jgi:hypothetical protein
MITFLSVVRRMKRLCPPEHPVKVRRLKLKDALDGYCSFKDDKFLIRINRGLEEHEAIETFLHELAHTHAWDISRDDHSDEWGKAYSRVYRAFLKEFLD